MRYYSRTPEEVEDRLSKRSIRSSRNRMLGRVIMFVNVMVLGAVVLFVRQTKQSQDASKHEPQNLSWNGWTVTAGCREDKCLMKMEPVQSAGRLGRYQWQMVSAETGELLYQEVGDPGPGHDKTLEAAFQPPFKISNKAKVFLRMLDTAGVEQFKIRVYP